MNMGNQDPDYEGFSGALTANMLIGWADASVRVIATVEDDEVIDLKVFYKDTEISDALNEAGFSEITNKLYKDWKNLVAASNKDFEDSSYEFY